MPLEAALDALEAAKLSKSDQASLVEHVAATLDLLRRADCAPDGDVRADAQAVRKAVEQLLEEKARNSKSDKALKACNSLIAETPDAPKSVMLKLASSQVTATWATAGW